MALPKVTIKDLVDSIETQRNNNQFTLGLIVRTKEKSLTADELSKQLPANILVEINKNSNDEEILSGLKKAFAEKKWLVIHLSDGTLTPLWREQLTRLRDSNSIFIQGKIAEQTFFSAQPMQMRVVAVIDNNDMKKITYPQFLNLFGAVLEV